MLTIYTAAARMKDSPRYRIGAFALETAQTFRLDGLAFSDDFMASTVALAAAVDWIGRKHPERRIVVAYDKARSPDEQPHQRREIEQACEAARRAAETAALVVTWERLAKSENPAHHVAGTASDYQAGRTLAAVGEARFEASRPLLANPTIRWHYDEARRAWGTPRAAMPPVLAQLRSGGADG